MTPTVAKSHLAAAPETRKGQLARARIVAAAAASMCVLGSVGISVEDIRVAAKASGS